MIKVTQFHHIKFLHEVEGLSQRQIAQKLGISRNTVKILQGRDRLEQDAFLALQSHYLFKAVFCNIRSGNEKGRMEGTVGYVRRNVFVPLPDVQSLEELNAYLLDWCLREAEEKTVPFTKKTVA